MTCLNYKAMKNAQGLSKTNDLIISLFLFVLFSRFYGNFGLNKVVSMSNLLFLVLMCGIIVLKWNFKMKPSSSRS